MRVAIVAPTLSHFEVPLYRLSAGLSGLDVRVFHGDPRDDAFFDKDYGGRIDWGEKLRGGYPNTYAETPDQMRREVIAWRPDVALQYGYSWKGALGMLAGLRGQGVPVVHRGLLSPYHNTRVNPLVSRAWRVVQPLLLRRFQAHHYGGSYSEQVLDRAGVPKDQRYFVPFSVDTPYFAARADDAEQAREAENLVRGFGWTSEHPVLLFMCQHTWFKAPDVMIAIAAEAMRRRPDVRLIMAGSGAMTDALKSQAEQHLPAGSYAFPGYVSSKQTTPYYLASSLVLFPSRYDTWSRGVNEAMLSRRPCIISRIVPAAGGLVDDGETGFVVDELAPAPFADSIVRYLSMPAADQARLREAARTRAQAFSYEAHVDDLRRSFVEVAERGRSSGRLAS